jgi:hypothetical protein
MSYQDIATALNARLAAIPGIVSVLDYEPTSAQASPLIYSLLDTVTRTVQGTTVRITYRTLHRLCIIWQDSEWAEEQLRSFIEAIPEALEARPRIGKADGQIALGDAGWAEVGNVMVRVLDFYSEVVEIRPYLGIGG